MLYIGLISFLFFLRHQFGKRRSKIYFLVLLGLFVFSAFRYRVGCDWTGYYSQYSTAENFDWSTAFEIREPLWWLILGLLNMFELPYPVANVLSSGIFFWGVHVFARRQPDPLGFLVLLFPILIINMPMSGIRQGAAIGLTCIAFASFIDRSRIRFAFWILIATGIHSSAIVFLLLLPLANGLYTRSNLILSALLAIPGLFFLASSDAAEMAASRYVGTEIDAHGAVFRTGFLAISSVFFFWVLRKKWLLTWPKDFALASIGSIGMILPLLLVPISSVIGDRLGYYLIPIQTMIFARLPFLPFRRNAELFSALPYIGLLLVFTVWSHFSWHFKECYIPYQTWIFGFPSGSPDGF
jgi:hypothetical protein